MKFQNFNVSLSTILIFLIASAKCCIYSSDLAELGKILLTNLDKTQFTDYEAIEDFKKSIEFAIKSSVVASPETVREIAKLTKLDKKEKYILDATETIEDYFNNVFSLLTPFNNYDVQAFNAASTQYNVSYIMKNSLTLLRGLFRTPMNTRRIIKTLDAQSHEYHCKSTLSLYQKIVGLHNRALMNLIMGFSTIIYLSKQAHKTEQDIKLSPEETLQLLLDMYAQYTTQAMNKITRAVEGVSREIHRCDPQEHEHGKTYDRLYDLVEYYLTSERFLNENNQCSAIPKNYDGVKHNSEIHKHIDESIKCQGTLYQCDKVDLKHLYLYGNDRTNRRYHAFSIANPQSPNEEILYGNIGDATIAHTKDDLNGIGENSPNGLNMDMNSTELKDMKHCSIYGCYCDNHDSPRSVRYFSTRLVTSAVNFDRVITGLRLKVQDRVVYFQIQTGKLIGLGVVDPATILWKEIHPVNITVAEHSPDAEYVKLDYNKRSLYLDDLLGPKGSYLTGVRFIRALDGIRIAAKFTPHDGLNLVPQQQSIMLRNRDVDRSELKIDNTNIPLYMMNLNNEPMGIQNVHYVQFQPSDIKNDAGQTTVPFLDVQSVITDPPTALGGFGIYLKGRPGSASFVALKLISPLH